MSESIISGQEMISKRIKKAIVLLSGGLDSTTVLYLAKQQGYQCYCLVFDYGQRHSREINSVKKIVRITNSKYQILKIALPWKGSSLLDKNMAVCYSERAERPKNLKERFFAPSGLKMTNGIPATYVPARNIIFLSFALSYAEAIGAEAIFIGVNAIDYSGYPDCRPNFYKAFVKAAKLGTKAGSEGNAIKILTPLINMTKSEIVKLGLSLGVPYQLTWSCYKGGRWPCNKCDSCIFRQKGFKEAGVRDPILQGKGR